MAEDPVRRAHRRLYRNLEDAALDLAWLKSVYGAPVLGTPLAREMEEFYVRLGSLLERLRAAERERWPDG